MYRPSSPWTWAFLIITLVQAAIALGFEGYIFAKFQVAINDANVNLDNGRTTFKQTFTIPTYLTLFIFGFVYQLVLVWDALRLKNTIQVIGLCIYNIGLLVYAAVQKTQLEEAVEGLRPGWNWDEPAIRNSGDPIAEFWRDSRPFLIAIPCVLGLGTLLMCFVAWKLYDEFAWTIYKHISADLRMKRRYLTYQIYIALLKFDFFFFLGFTVQFIVIVIAENTKDPEFGLTIAAIPVTIVILLLAGYWTRRENKIGMLVIIFLYFVALAYFLFKLIRMYQDSQREKYRDARTPLTTFAVITVILIVVTIVNACVCMYNFGRGLKPHIARRKVESEEEKLKMSDMPSYTHGPTPSRMVID